jgi:hypothetical protein
LAEVNGKYFYQPTRHFAVSASGNYGDKAVLRGLAPVVDFYNALIAIGAVAGENMTINNKEVTNVSGAAFAVNVTWEGAGRSCGIDEMVVESNNIKHQRRSASLLQSLLLRVSTIRPSALPYP